MNGRGVAGADTTPVYDGMLAAPKTYAFGTKIYLPSLGIGTVHDRGGAIIAKADYDRIDVWMGYGDEGLTRALNWGMRMIEGTIYPNGQNLEDNLNYNWIPTTKTTKLNVTAQTTVTSVTAPTSVPLVQGYFKKEIGKSAEKEDIILLQEKLKELGYLSSEANGTYGMQTIEAVYAFQKKEGIVESWNDYGSGYFGSKTRKTMNIALDYYELQKQQRLAEKELLENNPNDQIEETKLLITAGLGKNAEGEEVEELQKILKELGYYQGEITGEYDAQTIKSVFNFQKDYNVVTDQDEYGAGYFGSKTKEALAKAVVLHETKLDFGKTLAKLKISNLTAMETNLAKPNRVIAQVEQKSQVIIPSNVEVKTMFFEKKKPVANPIYATLTVGDKGDDVELLQSILMQQGLLKETQVTGYFGPLTESALIQYQIKQGIIPSGDAFGAGVLGPMTRQTLNASLDGAIAV